MLNENMSKLEERNVKFISIGTDRKLGLKRMVSKEKFNFPMLSDKDGTISKEYNIFGEPIDFSTMRMKLAIPTTVLINKSGNIVWQYLGQKEDRPTIEAIIEAIDNEL